MNKQYPIGTRIKFIGHSRIGPEAKKDIGKIGKIVGYTDPNGPIIFLPESRHISCYSTKQVPASWEVGLSSIEVLPQKGRQLLFPFME